MNEKMELALRLLKRVLIWFIFPLVLLIFCFFLGEQFEVGRLSAIASCEGSMNNAACIRSKGYLAGEPYYPDLGRRYFGAYARLIGGDLGASYRAEPKLPPVNPNKSDTPPEEDAEELEDKKPEVGEKKDKPGKER